MMSTPQRHLIESSEPMVWLFERGAEIVRLVTRYDETSKQYTVAIECPMIFRDIN